VKEKYFVTLQLIQLEPNLGKSNVESNVPRQFQVASLFALRERLVRAARMEFVFTTLLLRTDWAK
jgi:hypothetical protein